MTANEQNPNDDERKIPLTPRELKILAALEKWGVLGVAQLHGVAFEGASAGERSALFFNETSRKVYTSRLFKRLHRLETLALTRGHLFINHHKVYTLAERGHETLRLYQLKALPGFRDSIDESLVEHELTVAAAGLVMQELLGLTVRTERDRFQWNSHGGRQPAPERGISDLWIVDRARPKAVEVEMHQKSERRYAEIFDAYRRRLPEGGAVLYLTAWPSGVRCILRHAQNFRAPFVYACALADFQRTAGRARFESATLDASPIRLDSRALRAPEEALTR